MSAIIGRMIRRILSRSVTQGRAIVSTVGLECGHTLRVSHTPDWTKPEQRIRYAWDGENERGEIECTECVRKVDA